MAETILDLNASECPADAVADVAIIGGGIAGLVLAERLSPSLRVIVLESGPLAPGEEPSDLNMVEQTGDDYRAPIEGRTRGLGGTSTLWGGALLPFNASDFEMRQDLDRPAWPVSYASVQPYFDDVETLFDLPGGPYDWLADAPALLRGIGDFTPRYAKWPSFGRRNVATLLLPRLKRAGRCAVWVNATCTHFGFGENGRLEHLLASSFSGKTLKVRARHFILAAGAIESTRLLAWALEHANAPKLKGAGSLGRHLHDHVSAKAAEVETRAEDALNRLAGFRFEGSGLRSFRLELTASAQRRLGVGGAFAHISFEALKPSGFDGLRQFMRALQARHLDAPALMRAIADAPYLARAGYWRVAHRQLRWPRPARHELHLVIEQAQTPSNRISLSARRDRLGVPLAKVAWSVSPADDAAYRKIANCLAKTWVDGGLNALGSLRWSAPLDKLTLSDLDGHGDVFHPGGPTRMGADAATSIVDAELTVWGLDNLSIASTSIFPSGAGANPTMTLIAFAMRLADRLRSLARPPAFELDALR